MYGRRILSVIYYTALYLTLWCLWTECDIMQRAKSSALVGSDPNETHRGTIPVSGKNVECWELQKHGWSRNLLSFPSSALTSWLTDGRTCRPRKQTCWWEWGWKNSLTDLLNDKQIGRCSSERLRSTHIVFLTLRQVCLRGQGWHLATAAARVMKC